VVCEVSGQRDFEIRHVVLLKFLWLIPFTLAKKLLIWQASVATINFCANVRVQKPRVVVVFAL
jgi:hypothetical protein